MDSSPTPEVVDTPTESATPEPTPVAAQPSETGATEQEPTGPLPLERHKAILENARKKAAEEALKPYEWAQKYGDAQHRLAATEWLERDPVGFMRTYAANNGIDLASVIAAQQPAAPTPPPEENLLEPDIQFENGQLSYSHERVQKLLAQVKQQVDRELAPIKQERAVNQIQQQAQSHAQQLMQRVSQWYGMNDEATKKEVANWIRNNGDPNALAETNLAAAYSAVVVPRVQQQIADVEQKAYQKALTDLQTKAGAAGSLTPRTTGTAPARDTSGMSMREALVAEMAGE